MDLFPIGTTLDYIELLLGMVWPSTKRFYLSISKSLHVARVTQADILEDFFKRLGGKLCGQLRN